VDAKIGEKIKRTAHTHCKKKKPKQGENQQQQHGFAARERPSRPLEPRPHGTSLLTVLNRSYFSALKNPIKLLRHAVFKPHCENLSL